MALTKQDCMEKIKYTLNRPDLSKDDYYERTRECIDFNKFKKQASDMNAQEIAELFVSLKAEQVAEPFLRAFINYLQNRDDFDEMMKNETMAEIYG